MKVRVLIITCSYSSINLVEGIYYMLFGSIVYLSQNDTIGNIEAKDNILL